MVTPAKSLRPERFSPHFEHSLKNGIHIRFEAPDGRVIDQLPRDHPLHSATNAAISFARAYEVITICEAYAKDWEHFEAWCEDRHLTPLPTTPEIVAHYITELVEGGWRGEPGRKLSTASRRLAAINSVHRMMHFAQPASQKWLAVSLAMKHLATMEDRGQLQTKPLETEQLLAMLAVESDPIAAARNRALMLVGLVGALRRSELASLNVEDIERHPAGMTITIIDARDRRYRSVELPFNSETELCPVRAVENWIAVARIGTVGPLFRPIRRYGKVQSKRLLPASINFIFKSLAKRVDDRMAVDPSRYSIRSLGARRPDPTDHKADDSLQLHDQHDRQQAVGKLGL